MNLFFFLVSLGFPYLHAETKIARVTQFSVQGTVKEVSQVVARFSDPVVAFGDPSVQNPFDVSCSGLDPASKEAADWGSGRWLGPKEWAYDFKVKLPAGVRCEFRFKNETKTLNRGNVAAEGLYSFNTGGPAVIRSSPWEGSQGIAEDQIFVLSLDAAPEKRSVEKSVYFQIEGQGNRIPIRWISGKERQQILKSSYNREAKEDTIVIAADQKFPANTKVALIWGSGVKSLSGVATEKEQTFNYQTRKTFTAEFRCERENMEAGCSPVGWMSLSFNSPIRTQDAEQIHIKGQKGGELIRDLSKDNDGWVTQISFKAPFPEKSDFKIQIPTGIKDDNDRLLSNADKFPLSVRTDRFPPLAKFAASFGILELAKPSLLPVTVRNLEPEVKARLFKSKSAQGISFDELDKVEGRRARVNLSHKADILAWIQRIERHEPRYSIFEPQPKWLHRYSDNKKVPKEFDAPPEKIFPKPFPVPKKEKPQSFEVVGIPIEEPGFYVVEVESKVLGEALIAPQNSYHAPTAVLVTDLSVHFKWGRESSLAWVTHLKDATPAAGALVEVVDCHGKSLETGKSDEMGVVIFKNISRTAPSCAPKGDYHRFYSGLLVVAELGHDMTFVHTSMQDGIESWRFQLPTDSDHSPIIAHSVLDRTLLRAGEVVHMKSYLRQHAASGFAAVRSGQRPMKLRINHSGSGQKYDLPLKWDPIGFAVSEWKIPKEAKLGRYNIELVGSEKKNPKSYSAGSFRVEEFRVPLLKGTVQNTGAAPIHPKELIFDVAVNYLAGGPAAQLAVKLRTQETVQFTPSLEEFEGYTMANGAVKEGRDQRGTGDSEDEQSPDKKQKIETQEATLDSMGSKRFVVKNLSQKDVPFQLTTELEYPDPNGEIQTVAAGQMIYPSAALVGIKADSWLASKDQLKVFVGVANLEGKPVANRKVHVRLYEKKTYSHRKRLVGGYYAYENTEETKNLGDFCEGETNVRGVLICEAKPPQSGNLIAEAWASDSKGNKSFANQEIWVPGAEEWWFPVSDNDRMDLVPERKRYEPGELAKLQVRVPFREATLLVTVEREGVLERYVQKVSGKSPVIEVPISNRYAPNAYISVFAVRGRSGEATPTATVDLGKPAYKLGIAQIDVGWGSHQLKVKVETPRTVYRVRDNVTAEISVQDSQGKMVKGADVAVAVVDEGLLNLMPNDSWDLLTAMMNRRPYEIENATAAMHVIGKRHFGLKALPAGGGGGNQPTRELFDTLLFWKASLKTDAKGRALVQIPLNDSLTSFRIVAIAAADLDKFGTGKTSVRSNQDLMLFSGVSPVAREGDNTEALLTLRNASDTPLAVQATIAVTGIREKFPVKKVALKPGETKIVAWPLVIPRGVSLLSYVFEAVGQNKIRDKVRVSQAISPEVPIRVLQATLEQLIQPVELPVELPKGAIPGMGGIRVDFQPTLLAGAQSIRTYMKEYPYTCFEQEVSRAVSLRDEKLWKNLLKVIPLHQDADGLLKYFPTLRYGSESLTAYVIAVAHEAGWPIPEALNAPLLAGLHKFVAGQIQRSSHFATPDLVLRKLSVLEAISRYEANIDPALLKTIDYSPNLWPTSALIDWRNVLLRVASHSEREKQLKELSTILRSRLNYQGTQLGFSTEKGDSLWWLMTSVDTNAVRVLLSLMDDKEWSEELPRIVRGAIGRQLRGHWDLTLANAWGVLALEKFAKKFEGGPVNGSTQIALSSKNVKKDWADNESKPLMLAWPIGKGTVSVQHQGQGNPWVIFQSLAALPLKEAIYSGFRMEKIVSPVEQKRNGIWTVGDVVRVTLKIKSEGDQTWVVVNDPIPAGASLLGSGLGNSSSLLTQGEKTKGWAYPAFTERSFGGYRAYYEWVDKGDFSLTYTVRLNQAGKFGLPPTQVEAMYRPEIFAESPNTTWEVIR